MTPKEKAKELFDKYSNLQWQDTFSTNSGDWDSQTVSMNEASAKKAALICVDEILHGAMVWQFIAGKYRVFWNEVKIEIENINNE